MFFSKYDGETKANRKLSKELVEKMGILIVHFLTLMNVALSGGFCLLQLLIHSTYCFTNLMCQVKYFVFYLLSMA